MIQRWSTCEVSWNLLREVLKCGHTNILRRPPLEELSHQFYCRAQYGIQSAQAWDSRFSLKGTESAYAPDRSYDTEHIRLDFKIDFSKESLRGRCTTHLRAITNNAGEMIFDAVHFKIFGVKWNGKKTKFEYKDEKLKVSPLGKSKQGDKVLIEVEYETVKPKLGLYFIKPTKQYPKNPTQLWTQGEDEYARYWFPCFDAPHERTTTEVVATVPYGFTAISNGALIKTTHQKSAKTSTFHWLQKIPHATYLVTLTVGRFAEIKDKWRNIPVLYYSEKGKEDQAQRAFGKTPKMLEFFSKFIGVNYPYAKYAQIAAADFIYGGMENTSATTQTEYALLDERVSLDYTSDELVAHELAHQWFGDLLTCKSWAHAWLNESFATYFDALFKRHDRGQDEFAYAIRNNAEEYFSEDKERYRRSIVTQLFRRPSDMFDRHLYEKGSVVLRMLHHILGEELFCKSIKTYVQDHKAQVVETVDLINSIEKATGRNMRRFFDQWVFGAGHPEYRLRAWWDSRKKEIFIRTVQTNVHGNDIPVFQIETEFLFLTSQGEKREKVKLTKKSHLFHFKLSESPSMVLFDPDHILLKKADFPKSEKWLLTQLVKDKNPIGRIEAAQALAKLGGLKNAYALNSVLLKDSFWAVRAEVARLMGTFKLRETAELLLSSLDSVDHPKVRRAIYSGLKSLKDLSMAEEIERRFRKEPSYFVEAEGWSAMGVLQHPQALEILKEGLQRDSWNDVIRTAALEGVAALKSKDHLPMVISYTKPGHHQRLRMAAIRCLISFGSIDDEIQNRLLELTQDSFLLVQIAAVRGLHLIGDERAIPTLQKLTTGDRDGRLKRLSEEAIEKIKKGFE